MLARDTFSWLFFIGILLVVGGFYIKSRYDQIAPVAHLTSISQIQNLPPTICTYSAGAYGTGSGGLLYVYNNRLALIITELEASGYIGPVNVVISTNGTKEMDTDTANAFSHAANVADVINTTLTKAPWNCSPWWFPTESPFAIPSPVLF